MDAKEWGDEYYTGECGKGHPRSRENTRIRLRGTSVKRECRVCHRTRPCHVEWSKRRDYHREYIRRREIRGLPPPGVRARPSGMSFDWADMRDEGE